MTPKRDEKMVSICTCGIAGLSKCHPAVHSHYSVRRFSSCRLMQNAQIEQNDPLNAPIARPLPTWCAHHCCHHLHLQMQPPTAGWRFLRPPCRVEDLRGPRGWWGREGWLHWLRALRWRISGLSGLPLYARQHRHSEAFVLSLRVVVVSLCSLCDTDTDLSPVPVVDPARHW